MQDRRSRIAASFLALLTAVSIWLSLGTVAVISGDTHRVAALPSIWILIGLVVATVAAAWIARLRLEDAWPLLVTLLIWLPFLPGKVPAAFLIWQGPTEAFIWLLAIAGVIGSRPWKAPSLLESPDRGPWIAGAIVAVAAIAVFSQVRGVIPGGDEPHYLAATQSILKDFDLKVANNYASGDYLDYFPGRLEPHFLKRSTSGEIYSIHAPGVSIIVLPAFAVAGYVGAVLTMILIAALTAALTWRLAWRVSGSVPGAWAGVAAVFATTPYFFHIFTIYPEIIGSLCVAIGAWLLIDLADGREVSNRRVIATGAALALLPWLHSRFAVIAAVLGVVIVLRLAARPSAVNAIARFLAVPMIAGAAWFAFFWIIWGSPSPTAPYGPDTGTSASYIAKGLIGLVFDQQFGVLITAPIYVMTVAGMIALFRQSPRLAIELVLLVVPYAITVASYAMWWAGNAAPARFLVAIVPLAALPIALVGTRIVTVLLVIVSIALAAPRGFVESGRFIFNNRGGLDATIEWLTRSVDLSLALPSVPRDGGAAAVRDGLIWMIVFGATVFVAGRSARTRSRAARFAAVATSTALTVIVASSIVWSMREQPVITPDRSKLAAFAAYRPAWHSAPADFLEHLTIDLDMTRLSRLPAGEYRLSRGEPWQMLVGRNDRALAFAGGRLRLPVMLQSPIFLTRTLQLTPIAAIRPAVNRHATHAAQYEERHVYAFDEQVYLERDGFWTRANGSALVVIDADEAAKRTGLPISVTAGAVATTVTLSSGRWQQALAMTPGQKQDVMLPPAESGVWPLRIRSGAGFRPSEREPGNGDVRLLAAWIAIR